MALTECKECGLYTSCALHAAAPDMLAALDAAREHLRQYRAYSESMRAIGRGCSLSHQFSPEYLDGIIDAAIRKARGINSPCGESEVRG